MKLPASIFLLLTFAVIAPLSALPGQKPARTIEIHARKFAFKPAEITLKKGETVTLRLISDDATHSLVVPDLKINEEMKRDHPVEVQVTPTSGGDFYGHCGHFCGMGHGKMKFTVHVTE